MLRLSFWEVSQLGIWRRIGLFVTFWAHGIAKESSSNENRRRPLGPRLCIRDWRTV